LEIGPGWDMVEISSSECGRLPKSSHKNDINA
jgi:hypothetical protein